MAAAATGVPPALTLSEAYATLGLGEGSAYDEVLAAKNVLLERHADDLERRYQVEQAYDLIFASQLRARLTGDLPVASNVRFADVRRPAPPAPPAGAAAAAQKAQQLLQGIPGGGVAVQAPRPRTATTAAAVFGVLAAWTLAQGLLEPSPQSAAADVPGVQLALATAATVYLLREEKRMGLGKAIGLALVGLVVGTFVGAAVQSWLRVDIIPLGALSSPGILVGEFSIIALAAVCLFLA
ncbi:hypothetical protein CHLNCDRAFT_143604 [Chlorella variabilis]|uniref:Uncharacterized protein n=1 Tax=Chlorella variabilis TaxID=554065 RepID=E1ZA32_CHLVA|nr:hypothetical protein CHLNCDRAFT_143604 [Chlorella variabilis]EFN57194.1 hypothetical protein CHLNCDRAFT_143604 [Chlorella variabilis]|eukprot:XP_005849296.1 hypothetical protein CHLNCDRAFT_143604 [Chlorella variabilis]